MFGLEILDVVIGLVFVYLLLSLFATALNEYIAAVLNLRGKELAKGLGQLLDDLDEKDALKQAWDGVGARVTTQADLLTEQLYNHRLIRPFATRQGWMTRLWRWLRNHRWNPVRRLRGSGPQNPRLPSYIPARTFALALLDVLGVSDRDARLDHLIPAGRTPAQAVADAETAVAALGAKDAIAPAALPETEQKLAGARHAQAVADAEHALADAEAAAAAAPDKAEAGKAVAAARLNVTRARLAGAVAEAEAALAAAQRAHAAGANDATAKALGHARQALARVKLAQVLAILKQESSLDLTEHLATLGGLSAAGNKLAADLQLHLAGSLAGAQTQLQKLHDGVEVWFNNAMDRVSGAYKRTAQGWLFVLGLLIAACMNADTVDMWRRLEADDELRAAMVRRAEASVAAYDTTLARAVGDSVARANRTADPTAAAPPASADTTTKPDSTSAVKQARDNYLAARSRLDSMELKLGWTQEEAVRAGVLRRDGGAAGSWFLPRLWNAGARWMERGWVPAGYHADYFPFDTRAGLLKLFGLLLTAVAISLGAPFWFDLLNKVISIRAAGRSPEERPKSPEGGPKRIAERAPK